MIKIALLYGESDLIIGIEVKGHSNYASKGKDIVCSAVSIMVQSYALFLAKRGWLGDLERKSGYMKVIAKKASKDITLFLEEGLYALMNKYKRYMKVEEVSYGT